LWHPLSFLTKNGPVFFAHNVVMIIYHDVKGPCDGVMMLYPDVHGHECPGVKAPCFHRMPPLLPISQLNDLF